jgi:hypothetical protein
MRATLDLDLVHRLADSFPGDSRDWKTILARVFIADRNGRFFSDWSLASEFTGVGGIYAVLLPALWFTTPRTLHLHARKASS